jgi:hypothetical protein
MWSGGRLPDWTEYLGHEPLKLTAKHFPLPRSLRTMVMERYADPTSSIDADLAMDAEELFSYLRNMDYNAYYPMEGILAQTEAIGDPAQPNNEQKAILNWLGAATRDWEKHFSLEEPLAGELRRLRPLVAALAVTDASFLTPGAHPLHQLLDAIQMYAIGWQARLGRMGRVAEEEIRGAVDAALAWFDAPETNLVAISTEVAASVARASGRARKMTQRLIETEHGRIRIAESKQHAALMINAALEEFPAPVDVGAFLKGPWYDSAQLVLMKFGGDSAEWENMSLVTTRLLESLQNPAIGEADVAGCRQDVAELVKDLGHWLLSLQHDGEALRDALAGVESCHLEASREHAEELEKISPLPIHKNERGDQELNETLVRLREGQWFAINIDDSPYLRAILVLRMDDAQLLLFANQAGIKVLQSNFTEFAQLMVEGRVRSLDTGASFSRCLARNAGLETQDDLDVLTGVAEERVRRKEEERLKAEQLRLRLEQERAEQERAELERELREQQELEELQREMAEVERLQQEYEEAERLRREQAEQERQQLVHEREEAKRLQKKWEEASRLHRERIELERQQPAHERVVDAEGLSTATGLELSRCTWLGFRDGDDEEVVLARLAVYNRAQNDYIFVDRCGIKIRQLSGKELLLIMTRGLMDILEARSRFKNEVAQAQKHVD